MTFVGIWLLTFSFSSASYAATTTVDDRAGLFTDEQIQTLEQQAQTLDDSIKGRVFIVTTTESIDSQEKFADRYLLDTIGADENGSVLLLDMTDREIYISTSGNMSDYLSDSRLNSMLDDIYDDMSQENHFDAAQTYLTESAKFVEAGVPGGHYRVDRETGKITRYKVLTTVEIIIGLVLALVLSTIFFVLIKLKYQLKFGTYKYPYREKSSLQLSERDDKLIHSFVTTRRIPKANNGGGGGGGGSTTHSSGGGTFGGGGRSF
ncbi:hypothetical protein BAU15_10685 [Enterococcus sp. JM4C]|nr:hypothetical protein BAU15_10685 [Enterococcus sp. JM4C]